MLVARQAFYVEESTSCKVSNENFPLKTLHWRQLAELPLSQRLWVIRSLCVVWSIRYGPARESPSKLWNHTKL